MSNTSTSSDKTVGDDAKVKLIIGEIGRDTKTGIIGRGYSFDNGNTFHVTDTIFGRLYDDRDTDGIWNNGMHEKVKEKVNQEITNTVEPAIKQADSAVAYANEAIKKSRVNSQAIVDINSAVSDAVSDAAVARSDGLRAWNAAQSNVGLIDSNYASASAAISSARTEAIAAADEAKASASAAQADIVAVRSDVAAVQADVTATQSDVATAKSDIAVAKTSLTSQAKSLSSYAAQASAAGKDITTLKSQAGQLEQGMADTKGDVSQLKVSASSASVALSDAAGNIFSLQATAKSYSAALSDTNSNVASVTATASKLETKYADAAGDISQLQTDAKGMTQTISNAQGDIAKLKTRADGFDTEFASTNGDINKLQVDASGTKQTLTNAKSDIAVLQSRADGFDTKYADAAGDINTLKADASGMKQTLTDAKGDISTLQATATGFKNTLTDAQGNISTLQSDVSGLKKTTSDHAGNIATLQADAKTLTSQMSSAQGDISTLKQTASGFSSKVSGMETSLANANSKINGITSNGGGRNLLLGTVPKDMNNLNGWSIDSGWVGTHTFVDGGTTNLFVLKNSTTKENFIWSPFVLLENGETYTLSYYAFATINTTNSGEVYAINNNYSEVQQIAPSKKLDPGHAVRYVYTFTFHHPSGKYHFRFDNNGTTDGKEADMYIGKPMFEKGTVAHDRQPAPEDTDAKITTNSTAIEQNKKAIALKADQTTVDKTNETVQQLRAQLNIQADQISAKVSSSDLNAKGYATQTYTQTQIKQTADSWNANLTSVKNGLTDKYTNLHATVDGIQAQVYNSDGSSKITQLSNLIATKVSSSDFTALNDRTMQNRGTVNAPDFNSLTQAGYYTITSPDKGKNYPTGNWGTLEVSGQATDANGRLNQKYVSDNNSATYTRQYNASTKGWTAWSEGATESEIIQLSDDINIRVKKGDVVSQINQEAGGNTLIRVSGGKGNLILNANTVDFTGGAFIPAAYITDLTADKIKTGTLTGSTIHLDDGNGNTIDLGGLATSYVGFHSKATNGDQTYIDRNGIHNYGASYDTKISQGKITTNYMAVNGGGLIDFRSNGNGTTIDSQNIKFYNSNTVNGGIEFSGGNPIATVRNGTVGNELRVRYDRSFALTPIKDESARICASSAAMQVGFVQSGRSTPDRQTTGLWVDGDKRHVNLGVWGADSTWARVEANTHNIHMQADKAHAWLSSDNVFHIYKNGDSSSTATQLRVDGWAWINGWVEAAGHSQHSALSTKTDIQPVDDDKMLEMINDTDLATFLYKTDVANGDTHRHIGLIIDDVHDVAQYQTPQDFIAPNGVSRDDDNMIGALFGAVKALTKRIKTLESKVG